MKQTMDQLIRRIRYPFRSTDSGRFEAVVDEVRREIANANTRQAAEAREPYQSRPVAEICFEG